MDNNPQVMYTPPPANPPKESFFKAKYLLYVLVAVVVIEILWAAKTLLSPIPVKKAAEVPVITDATLSLISSKKDFKQGEILLVNINLQTGGHKTIGTDIVLKYNPKVLETSQTAFIRGTVYPDYPLIKVDNEKGLINISGVVTSKDGSFEGTGLFGQVAFKAKSVGLATVQLEFIKDASNDSNVIETGTPKDILGKVNNLEVNVR